MTTSIRFCLSYDHFYLNFIALKFDNFSTECMVDMDVVMTLLVSAKVLLHMWPYDIYDNDIIHCIAAMSYDKKKISVLFS